MSRFAIILVILSLAVLMVNGQVPGTPDSEAKCGGCPCNNPCSVPPPPPPALPPPPPPPKKKPPTPICPPPPGSPSGPSMPTPPSQYIYETGPPGDLYPVDPNFSGAVRSFAAGLLILLISSSIIQLALW